MGFIINTVEKKFQVPKNEIFHMNFGFQLPGIFFDGADDVA